MTDTERASSPNALSLWRLTLRRGLLFALAWWALSRGDADSWVFGLGAVVASLLAARMLGAGTRGTWRVRRVAAFAAFFIHQSVRGGIDVARRALHPRPPIAPAFVRFSFRLPEGPSRVFLISVISLLPGTLSAELNGAGVLVHVLDEGMPFRRNVRALEDRVAALFGHILTGGRDSEEVRE